MGVGNASLPIPWASEKAHVELKAKAFAAPLRVTYLESNFGSSVPVFMSSFLSSCRPGKVLLISIHGEPEKWERRAPDYL
jgi:hypothetical protein